jgi:hypothetical protein
LEGLCFIYRKILNSSDNDRLQINLNRLEEWAVENEMKINPDKSKAGSFIRARVKDQLRYYSSSSSSSSSINHSFALNLHWMQLQLESRWERCSTWVD